MYYQPLEIKVFFEKVEYLVKIDPSKEIKDLKVLIKESTKVREDLQCLVVESHLLKEDNDLIKNVFRTTQRVKLYLIGKTLRNFLSSHQQFTESQILHDLEIDQKLSYSDEPFEDGSYMIVKEIIKDGSCLYSAINYAMYQEEGNGFALRELVHDLLQTEEYTDFKNCIDQPIEEYFRNLIVHLVWGGELEISILAKYFKTQIHVIYMKELNFHSYGPENSFRAIFLLYTGSHYNLIVRNFLDGEKDMDVTLFQIGSRNNQDKAASAAQNFTLKCEYEEFVEFFCDTCKRSFQGKSLSSLHHQETGHNVISKC